MARYCFYCNKELQPGQSCDCRHARKIHGEATDDHASAPADEPQPATGNVADAANTNDGATAEPKARRSRRRSRRTDSPRQTSGIPRANGFRQAFAFLLNFFKDPIGAAKQQTRYSNLRVFGLILMEAVFGLLSNALFRSSPDSYCSSQRFVRPPASTPCSFLFSFLAGFLISLFRFPSRTLLLRDRLHPASAGQFAELTKVRAVFSHDLSSWRAPSVPRPPASARFC